MSQVQSLTVSSILNLLTADQERELYKVLKERRERNRPNDYISLDEKLEELRDKYFDLVWYARKDEDDRENHPGVDEAMTRVECMYTSEIEDLIQDETNWQHGFNSGALAISRLIRAYAIDDINDRPVKETKSGSDTESEDSEEFFRYMDNRDIQIEMAEDDFPMLDT